MIVELCDTRTTCGACGAHLRLTVVDVEPIGGVIHELDCPACGAHVPLPEQSVCPACDKLQDANWVDPCTCIALKGAN